MGAFCYAQNSSVLQKKRGKMEQVKLHHFIEITKKEFQQYQSEPITDAQAVEIQNNLFGVVELLLKWDKKARNKQCA